VRLIAFVLIIYAIVDKNLKRSAQPPQSSPPKKPS
jgi:hypothetical protein